MNRKNTLAILLIAALVISGFSSCLTNRGLDDAHNSKNSLDWEGIYTGTTPSASGTGINVSISLNRDETFVLTYEYPDRTDNIFSQAGSFNWVKGGNIIKLSGVKDTSPYYKVAENALIQLDMKGKPISGDLADYYVLTKQR